MSKYFFYLSICIGLFSCSQKKTIVENTFTDSLISNYKTADAAMVTEQDLSFWQTRYNNLPPDLVNKQKYAQALAARFSLYADIHDLLKADSIYTDLNNFYKGKEPGVLLTLANYKMLQHRFNEARVLIDSAAALKAETFAVQMMLFDASFETGNSLGAASILHFNKAPESFAYNFRLSKQDHYAGELDSAIAHMLKAASLAQSPNLKQAALSNAADLYIHAGKINEAYNLYKQCVKINPSDFHSITGIGWIALVHDKNDSLALKVFSFVHNKIKSPDPLWRMMQATELTDTTAAKNYAQQFVIQATDSSYGSMYNKYLIDIYTGILHQPAAAVKLAEKEISNRATSQTYAWLAWSYAANGQVKEANEVYQKNVSGKPLEGLELFWMGKMMSVLGKKYNSQQFFKAAANNRYDLSPVQQKELDKALD